MDLYALLELRGFVARKIVPKGVDLRAYQAWMENCQYANCVAISRLLVAKLQP